ncbi:MAG: AAA family ATPase, partial [Polyangiaceae bacterium]
ENIIIEPLRAGGDFVKVVDFGLAKMQEAQNQPSITSPGIVCGTPEYMSPEQGRGDPLDPRSDLYAVGVILFQLLTGRLPFEAESPTQVVLMHLSKAPPDPRQVAPERMIPMALVDVVRRSLSKEPQDRYSNADEFSRALSTALAHIDGPASSRSSTQSAVRCQKCGAMNPLTQKFCGECGAMITIASVLPTSRPQAMTPPRLPSQSVAPSALRRPSGSARTIHGPLPLVGRDDDLAWLEDRRTEARASLSAARIVGDSGMGKTRLLREFLLTSAAAGDVVVVTGPDPTWSEVGFFALRKAMQSLAALPPDGGRSADWVATTPEARCGIADVFHISGSEDVARLSPDERRFAAAEALRWALARASERARGKRVVLAVDDLQAVDGGSRNAFMDVVAEPPLVPVLLVAAHTPDFNPDWPSHVSPPRVISGLPSTLVSKLLATASAPSSPSISSGRGIAPLYIEQLLRFTREHGGGAPPRLADLIALRVERVATDERRLLQAIAVVGDNADRESLEFLLPDFFAGSKFDDALTHLRSTGMVEEAETGGLRVSHPLLREIVLATIPAEVRRELHRLAAEAAEERRAPVEVCALHELHAQNAFDALLLLERVAAQCAARGDVSGNILALRRGLELARRELFRGELDDPMRAVLIFSRKLGESLAVAGSFVDAEGVLREALDMAGPSGQDRARVLGALAHVAHGRARRQEAQAYLREALELASRANSPDLLLSLEDLQRALAS